MKICGALQSAVHRQAEVMQRPDANTLRRGPITAVAQTECTLELSGIQAGSTALLFRYTKPQQSLPIAATFGSDVLTKVVGTIKELEQKDLDVEETDPGVLSSLRDLGEALERKSITRMSLSVPDRQGRRRPVSAVYTPAVRDRIAARMKAPREEHQVVEGKLEMADFKDMGRLFRIHPSIGQSVICSFDPSKEPEVLAAITRPVRVSGSARVNPNSGKLEELRAEKIEVVDELMLGARDFVSGYSLEKLAEMQGVRPLASGNDLAGGWPEDEDIDEFIDTTYRSRH
jgi:hypothetical protein